jgi:hypothetical protein
MAPEYAGSGKLAGKAALTFATARTRIAAADRSGAASGLALGDLPPAPVTW